MFMAPLINAGVEGLMEKSPAVAWSAWLSFAVGMTLNWMPHHAFSGCAPVGGYNLCPIAVFSSKDVPMT